ncbi:MAG: hypothetical protein QXD48_02115 [Candidatus Aenigmatarchaeota archaeon]
MNKIAMIFIILMVSSVASARIIDLNENNIVNGAISQNGSLYKVLFATETFSNNLFFKRIIVENETKIIELQNEINNLRSKINGLQNEINALENKTIELNEIRKNNEMVLENLKTQREFYENLIVSLESQKNELENKLTSNVVISPTAYRIGIIVFAILIVILILLKINDIFFKKREEK